MVTEHGVRSTCKDSRQALAVVVELAVTDGIDASVDSASQSIAACSCDDVPRETESFQLLDRDDPVLILGQRRHFVRV